MEEHKRGQRKNGRNVSNGQRLLNAKQKIDEALSDFDGFPELRELAMQLRELTLKSLVELELKLPGV